MISCPISLVKALSTGDRHQMTFEGQLVAPVLDEMEVNECYDLEHTVRNVEDVRVRTSDKSNAGHNTRLLAREMDRPGSFLCKSSLFRIKISVGLDLIA